MYSLVALKKKLDVSVHANESKEWENTENPFSHFPYLHPFFKNHAEITQKCIILPLKVGAWDQHSCIP